MKPKLFDEEFVKMLFLLLAMMVCAATIYIYKNTLTTWQVLFLGLWYPAVWLVAYLYSKYIAGPSRGEDL